MTAVQLEQFVAAKSVDAAVPRVLPTSTKWKLAKLTNHRTNVVCLMKYGINKLSAFFDIATINDSLSVLVTMY